MTIWPLRRLHRDAVDFDVDQLFAHAVTRRASRAAPTMLWPCSIVVLELVPVMLDEALHRPRRGVAERADRVPFDLVRDVDQHVDVAACGPAPP